MVMFSVKQKRQVLHYYGRPITELSKEELVCALTELFGDFTELNKKVSRRRKEALAKEMTWQPIDSAPRDGTFFIAANSKQAIICNWPENHYMGHWIRMIRQKDGKRYRDWYGSAISFPLTLTHWTKLLKLPPPLEGSVKTIPPLEDLL